MEELQSHGCRVPIDYSLEPSNRWRDLEPQVEDLALSLKTYVLGPLNHTAQVARWLNILTNSMVSRLFLDQMILYI